MKSLKRMYEHNRSGYKGFYEWYSKSLIDGKRFVTIGYKLLKKIDAYALYETANIKWSRQCPHVLKKFNVNPSIIPG